MCYFCTYCALIYHSQFPTGFNQFHSMHSTDHVLLLYTLCICVKKILCYRNGADQTKKNDRGETPYDLAVKGGYDSTVKKFASAMGSSQLKKMVKPKTMIPAS